MNAASILSSELDEFFDAPETRSLFNTPTAICTRPIPSAQESILNHRPSKLPVQFRLSVSSSLPAHCSQSPVYFIYSSPSVFQSRLPHFCCLQLPVCSKSPHFCRPQLLIYFRSPHLCRLQSLICSRSPHPRCPRLPVCSRLPNCSRLRMQVWSRLN